MSEHKNKNTKFSNFSDLSWAKEIKGTPLNFVPGEVWPNELPTRSDLNDLDSYENIVVIIGDSFIFGHGVSYDNTIDYYANDLSGDTKFINLGTPGCSNDYTVKLLNQWFNTQYAEKTTAVIFNVAPLSRFFSTISLSYMNYIPSNKPNLKPRLYDHDYENRAYCYHQNLENPLKYESIGSPPRRVIHKAQREHQTYFSEWATPLNDLVALEEYFIQMYWMCRGLDIPFYYLLTDSIVNTIYNEDDLDWFYEKLASLSEKSKLQYVDIRDKIDVVWNPNAVEYNKKVSDIFLPCGHWTPTANKIIADRLFEVYTNGRQ